MREHRIIELNDWKISSILCTGDYHKGNGTSCQDRVGWRQNGWVTAICLSDGAGSCMYASEGAEIAVESILKVLTEDFDTLFEIDENALRFHILMSVRTEMDRFCREKDTDFTQLGATIVAVAVSGQKMITVHLGDGWITDCADTEKLHISSLPENGRRRNQTYLTSHIPATKHIRIQREEQDECKTMTLFSDGWGNQYGGFDFKEIGNALYTGQIAENHWDDVGAIRIEPVTGGTEI